MPHGISPSTGEEYYSGTVKDITKILAAMDIGAGKLSTFGEAQVACYQEMVDRNIDDIVGELYHVPLLYINQCQPDGTTKKIIPGSVRFAAQYWVAGLILKNEFQQLAQNTTDQAEQYVTQAKKDIFAIIRYNHRLYGQRRKSNISRTLPPGMQPPTFPEANF
jgi:hypothetical protein